jgi:hypothetical protein
MAEREKKKAETSHERQREVALGIVHLLPWNPIKEEPSM